MVEEPTHGDTTPEVDAAVDVILDFVTVKAKAHILRQENPDEPFDGSQVQTALSCALQIVTGAMFDRGGLTAESGICAYGTALGSYMPSDDPDNLMAVLELFGRAFMNSAVAISSARDAGIGVAN